MNGRAKRLIRSGASYVQELAYDVRANALLIALRLVIGVLMALALYTCLSLSAKTSYVAQQVMSKQQQYDMYSLVDTMVDPDVFHRFMNDERHVDAMAAFYNDLYADDRLLSVSAFTQPIPVSSAAMGTAPDASLLYRDVEAATYEEPGGSKFYECKSVQISRKAFGFFDLRISDGTGFAWDTVSYASGSVPVLLGSNWRPYLSVGSHFQGQLYGESRTFEVVGFLDGSSALWTPGNPDVDLSSFIVLPYPEKVSMESLGTGDIYPIVASAMFNGGVAAPSGMSPEQVVERLGIIADRTGFEDYTIVGMQSYQVHLRLMRRLLEDSGLLVAALVAVMAVVSVVVLFCIDAALAHRRGAKVRVARVLGWNNDGISRYVLLPCAVEAVVACLIFMASVLMLPNRHGLSCFVGIVAPVALGLVSAVCQSARVRNVLGGEDGHHAG